MKSGYHVTVQGLCAIFCIVLEVPALTMSTDTLYYLRQRGVPCYIDCLTNNLLLESHKPSYLISMCFLSLSTVIRVQFRPVLLLRHSLG